MEREPFSGFIARLTLSGGLFVAVVSAQREVISVATVTTNLLSTPLEDPRVERVRRTALAAYVDGKISFAQANSRVRKALERFHV
ncbi:hypothetical protein [Frankia sp. CiP1_Cm_nod2]|uniref:hypothetical protein n=1 Tax=Frankia sp. CiP1_Cm_nod2 TaxID=2897161 RepID=UPI002025A9C9